MSKARNAIRTGSTWSFLVCTMVSIILLMPSRLRADQLQSKPLRIEDLIRGEELGDSDTQLIEMISAHTTEFNLNSADFVTLQDKYHFSEALIQAIMASILRGGRPGSLQPTGSVGAPNSKGESPQAAVTLDAAHQIEENALAVTLVGPDDPSWKIQPPRVPTPSGFVLGLDWRTVSPHKILRSATYTFLLSNVNDIIYDYNLTITLNPATSDNISLLAGVLKEVTTLLPSTAGAGRPALEACAPLKLAVQQATPAAAALASKFDQLKPAKIGDKYQSLSVSETSETWKQEVVPAYKGYIDKVRVLQGELRKDSCKLADGTAELIVKASQVVVDSQAITDRAVRINAKVQGDHIITGTGSLERTREGSIVVSETYQGVDTVVSPKSFPLEAGFSVVTASGGFLLTSLQARSYSSRNAPPLPPATATRTVLGIDGGSGIRPALVGILNYHDPFSWPLNRPNFGFALSAGPVIDVSNGKADTSRFGAFAGVSVHISQQLFITPGVHIGEFADFPVGFTRAGQAIPQNFGSLTPAKRYTARFAIGVTFRGSNPTSLTGAGSSKQANTSTKPSTGGAAPTGPKQ